MVSAPMLLERENGRLGLCEEGGCGRLLLCLPSRGGDAARPLYADDGLGGCGVLVGKGRTSLLLLYLLSLVGESLSPWLGPAADVLGPLGCLDRGSGPVLVRRDSLPCLCVILHA